ncbi:MAG: hypothetical protein NT018_12680, partial [Armatimonadetes bacterium]|nr:hypothetical protein [Armatimonadota bacterium]
SAANMAKAGMEYALWQVKEKNATLPLTCDVTLNTGSFHVEATDDSLFVPGGMLIKSTGTSASDVYTVQRVLTNPNGGQLPYSYLWCQENNINSSAIVRTSGLTHGIRSNGNINLSNAGTSVANGAWAHGTITTAGSVNPQYAGSHHIDIPLASAAYYMSIATEVKNANTTLSRLKYKNMSAVIYVRGSCTIDPHQKNDEYAGVITVFAEGVVTIQGDLLSKDVSSHFAVISATGIVIGAVKGPKGATVDAVLYSCNSGAGFVSFLDDTALTGCVIADSVTSIGTLTLYTDSGLDATVLKELHLPGT